MADPDSLHQPSLGKHMASYDQDFPEDEEDANMPLFIEPQSNLLYNLNNNINPSPQSLINDTNNSPMSKNTNNNATTPQPKEVSPPPPPLVDLVALITPKQISNSKKWSVGVNYTSTSIIFEYLESARLAIQNDGRLFIPSAKKTLSSTHSSLPPSQTNIPRISHISVPRTIYFSNNAVVRINREWHIGELLPVMYTANMNPPTISKQDKSDYTHAVNQLNLT